MARERLRASGEAVEGEKKRIRRGCLLGEEEVDILGCCCWWRVGGKICCCYEVGSSGFVDDECFWWRSVGVRDEFCSRMQGRREGKRKFRTAREDMNFFEKKSVHLCWLSLV